MSDNAGFWRAYTYEVTQVGPADAVAPAVLAQALGSQLGPGEEATCARFVRLTGGRLLGSTGGGSHVVIVTDRRVMRVTAREQRVQLSETSVDPATSKWPAGRPIEGGTLYRYEAWLGQVREVERRWYWGKDRWLALCTLTAESRASRAGPRRSSPWRRRSAKPWRGAGSLDLSHRRARRAIERAGRR